MDIRVCKRLKADAEELCMLFASLSRKYSSVEIRYITLLRLLYDLVLERLPERVRRAVARALALAGFNRLLFYEICVEKWDVS
jgi:hypothetical protein